MCMEFWRHYFLLDPVDYVELLDIYLSMNLHSQLFKISGETKCGKLGLSPFNSHLFCLYIFQTLTAHLVEFAVVSGTKLC